MSSTISSATRSQISQTAMDDDETRKSKLMEALKEEDDESDDADEKQPLTPTKDKTPNPGKNGVVDAVVVPGPIGSPPPAPVAAPTSAQSGSSTAGSTNKPANRFKKKLEQKTGQQQPPPPQQGTQGPVLDQAPQRQGAQVPQQAPVVQPKYVKPKYRIEGSNIGSIAKEPDWSSDQLQLIARLTSMRINTLMMGETRRSHPDPEGKYVIIGQNGSISAKPPSWLGNIPWSEFFIGMGRPKPDEKTGKNKSYSDIVMKGKNWVLNQWTMEDVVMEHVPDNILEKAPRSQNGRIDRRIGHDFVRIGIPKLKAAPIFETIRSNVPAVMTNVSVTSGYYWTNASWGVTGNPGKFVYKDANGVIQETFKAYDAMKMLNGMSSIGVATIAISIGSNTKMEGGKMVPVLNEEEFSIKIHNMLHLRKVPYSSPPQSAANGFDVTDDIYASAESLSMPSGMSSMFSSTAGAFSDQSMNPFVNQNLSNSASGGRTVDKLLF